MEPALFKIFGDPFNTAGLVIDPAIHVGFTFEILDVIDDQTVRIKTLAEVYDLLALIGTYHVMLSRSTVMTECQLQRQALLDFH